MPSRKSNAQSSDATTATSATAPVSTVAEQSVNVEQSTSTKSASKRAKVSTTSSSTATDAVTTVAAMPSATATDAPSSMPESNEEERKTRQMSVEDIIAQIDEQLTHNEQELARLKERSRLKEVNRVLRDVKRFVAKYDQQQKKMKSKPKQTRKPTGFARPRGLSDEMIQFLNSHAGIKEIKVSRKDDDVQSVKIEHGCKLARNELTKALCDYFKDSNMRKDPEDKRKIFLDDATRKLFRIDLNEFKSSGGTVTDSGEPVITYFALQKYLPIHCLKEE